MRFFSLFSRIGFSNSYLIGPDAGGDAVLIDPGVFDAALLQAVENNGLYVRSILVTHAHNAHINGIRSLLKVYNAAIYANQPSVLDFPAHHAQDGDVLPLGELSARVFETPGHSIDSLCFLISHMLFTGDTLSAGSIGRTRDGYARGLLLESVRRKLLAVGDEVLLFPGHGPPSKVGIEKLYNPLLGEKL
ncbi:MAG: MBL fold metallo-hydrolase [Spirochaetia bacterium]|jgi:glyoxylase-like metal-dependent hydrolase (beta-lactamase superfamily II)